MCMLEHKLRLYKDMSDLRALLKNGINDEALRRMARRAGVQATSQKERDHVNDALRGIGFQILENICEKLAIYTQYREAKTVSQGDFRAACDQLKINLGGYAVPNKNNVFEKCRKYSPGARATKRTRGELGELEKRHEQKILNCVYNESAPFVRLVRDVMSETEFGSALRFTPATLSWLQYIVEQLLINILKAAGQIVKDTTLGPKGGASRATLSYRDLAAVLDTLEIFSCAPVLDGCSKAARDEGKSDGDSGDDGGKKGKPKPAAKRKAKGKAKSSGRGSGGAHTKSRGRGSGGGHAKAKAKASAGKGSGRGRAGLGGGSGRGRGRGKSTAREPVRELQSLYHPMDKEKAKDKSSLFAAKFSKDKGDM